MLILYSEKGILMARPKNCRTVRAEPEFTIFKPPGIPMRDLEDVNLTIDEFEAVRLADLEGLYQEHAAERMNVSRQTFGRILDEAHKKIADVLFHGKALIIEGGDFKMEGMRNFKCYECEHTWDLAFGTGRPAKCPKCGSTNFHRVDEFAGAGGGKGRGRNRGPKSSPAQSGGGQQRGKQCGVKIETKHRDKQQETAE